MKRVITPPIKSQGIKTKLVPWIKSILPEYHGQWIEPFMGTGVVGFNLAKEKAIFADINPHLINFYDKIRTREITPLHIKSYLVEEGTLLRNAGNAGYDHYRFVRDRFNSNFQPEDFLFLSRSGFNGMIRFSKKGKWNIPFCKKPDRFAQAYVTKIVNQVDNIQKIIKKDWKFYNYDFEKTLSLSSNEDLIYCDPPYLGRYVDYYNGWNEMNERRLSEILASSSSKFILSTWHHNDYRSNEFIKKYWGKFNLITKEHFYHTGAKIENRNSIYEALICNFEINNKVCEDKPPLVSQEQLF